MRALSIRTADPSKPKFLLNQSKKRDTSSESESRVRFTLGPDPRVCTFNGRRRCEYARDPKVLVHCGVICLTLLIGLSACYGGEFHNALSLQGFTGLLNTPNAEVTDEGKAYILFSNQKESQWRDLVPREESYIFSVGLFSFAEIGGRLTDAAGVTRDLSANAKVRLPFSSIRYFLPDIAFGMQDMGGGAKNLQTKYVVATEELWRLRFSLGYGTGPDRMDGVFGGVEFKTFDWLYLIGEHDTKETNIGIRLVTPEMFGLPVHLQATAKTSLDYRSGNTEFGIGLQFPLGADYLKKGHIGPKKTALSLSSRKGNGRWLPLPAAGGGKSFGQDDSDGGLQRLREKLVDGGFLNVRVGADREKALLVIEYENSRYNHNELDGLGVVAGLAVDTVSPDFEIIRMIILKKGIRILQVSALISDFREFLHDTGKSTRLYGSLEVTPEASDDKTVRFIDGDANPSRLKSELVVYPGLKTYVGTEVGVFDYLLSVKPDYYLNLWKGAVLNARFDIPVSWSENFDDGKAFRDRRESSQADRFMLFQTIKVDATGDAQSRGGDDPARHLRHGQRTDVDARRRQSPVPPEAGLYLEFRPAGPVPEQQGLSRLLPVLFRTARSLSGGDGGSVPGQ